MFAATANHLPSIQFAETYNTICRIAIVGGVGKARRVHACSRDSHPQQNKTELARKFEATAFNLVSSDSRSLGALRPAVAEEIDRDRERERARARARRREREREREGPGPADRAFRADGVEARNEGGTVCKRAWVGGAARARGA